MKEQNEEFRGERQGLEIGLKGGYEQSMLYNLPHSLLELFLGDVKINRCRMLRVVQFLSIKLLNAAQRIRRRH